MAIYIKENDVHNILNMQKALELTEEAFCLYGRGEAYNMPRFRQRIKKGALHMLPAALPSKGVFGYKAYTSFRAGIKFRFYLHSAETGELLAVLDADTIGRLRTGAASGVATKYLSRPDASRMVVFGAGAQAGAQVEAVRLVRKISHIDIVTRTRESAEVFAATLSKTGVSAAVADNPALSVANADIITTITTSAVPVLLKDWEFKPGAHINAAGSNALVRSEVAEKIVEKSFIVVDDKEVARLEAGDLLPSLEKGRIHWNNITELGDIVAGNRPIKPGEHTLTLFESQGMGLLDLICAEYVYVKAMEQSAYIELPI